MPKQMLVSPTNKVLYPLLYTTHSECTAPSRGSVQFKDKCAARTQRAAHVGAISREPRSLYRHRAACGIQSALSPSSGQKGEGHSLRSPITVCKRAWRACARSVSMGAENRNQRLRASVCTPTSPFCGNSGVCSAGQSKAYFNRRKKTHSCKAEPFRLCRRTKWLWGFTAVIFWCRKKTEAGAPFSTSVS